MLFAVGFSGCTENNLSELGYSNEEYGFGFNPPGGWRLQEQNTGVIVIYASPPEDALDNFAENINVLIENLTEPISSYEYSMSSLQQLQNITNFNLTSFENITFAGIQSNKIVYTGAQAIFNLTWMQVLTIKNSRAFIITFTAEQDKYSDYIVAINDVIDSFVII
jgi:serine/threonine-protein kinase